MDRYRSMNSKTKTGVVWFLWAAERAEGNKLIWGLNKVEGGR